MKFKNKSIDQINECHFDEKRGKIIVGEDFRETVKECKQYLINKNKYEYSKM